MSLYNQFRTDTSLEKAGIVLQYGTNTEGMPIEIRVARAGGANKRYLERLEAKVKPFRRQIQNETIERALLDKLLMEVFADTVVIGWNGVQDEHGKALPYSKENCIKLFSDLPDLWADVQEQAQRAALFRAEIRDADAKNS